VENGQGLATMGDDEVGEADALLLIGVNLQE
jgi:hypothetical protein